MLWSIAVPVNRFDEKLLMRCLKSVLTSRFPSLDPKNVQLMVVDSSGDPRVKELVSRLGYFNWYAIPRRGAKA